MGELTRREMVQVLAGIPLLAAGVSPAQVKAAVAASRAALSAPSPYSPVFFTAHEWETVRLLVDIVIPRDEHSGSATDAGVPEFMDFILNDQENLQIPIRGGLGWLDSECRDRFGKDFLGSPEKSRAVVLDDVAWPEKARSELSQGVAFFSRLRDFTASGFYSSRLGVEDLQYLGNTLVTEWNGCPPEALRKLGVSYGG